MSAVRSPFPPLFSAPRPGTSIALPHEPAWPATPIAEASPAPGSLTPVVIPWAAGHAGVTVSAQEKGAAPAATATLKEIAPAATMMTRRVVLMTPCFLRRRSRQILPDHRQRIGGPMCKTPQVTAWFTEAAKSGPEYRLPVQPERKFAGSRENRKGPAMAARRGPARRPGGDPGPDAAPAFTKTP